MTIQPILCARPPAPARLHDMKILPLLPATKTNNCEYSNLALLTLVQERVRKRGTAKAIFNASVKPLRSAFPGGWRVL